MRKYLNILFLLLSFILAFSVQLIAQVDSIQIDLDQLNWKDVRNGDNLLLNTTKVISGSRTEKEVADLPFTIYVVTGEEIRENGFVTLTDVLKNLPGIRVSQPGSGLEGETFLMRGLLGNAYAKILINDVPVKPFVVSGMPIGAQLPIRQAERIEVIYGPAATLYGADASAGVINIIMKDTERPIYVQSDLGLGARGYNNLDLMVGGKLGRNKRVLKFQLYGSYTGINDLNVVYDLDTLYNPDVYTTVLDLDEGYYLERQNYQGERGAPTISQLPHLSNLLGVDLKYQNFHLMINRMFRRDHSAIGISPLAVSYASPLNYFGEFITNLSLDYTKEYKKWGWKTSLGFTDYRTDPGSSQAYVNPLIAIFYENFFFGETDSLAMLRDEYYFSDNRFSAASSREGNLETLVHFDIGKYIDVSAGTNLQYANGTPLQTFRKNPVTVTNAPPNLDRVLVNGTRYFELSSFMEMYFNFKKVNAILGAQYLRRWDNYLQSDNSFLNPRVAFLYKVNNALSFRASSGTAFRFPSPFYAATTYAVNSLNIENIQTGAPGLTPERTLSVELGTRWSPRKFLNIDVALIYNRTKNFINYAIQLNNEDVNNLTLGYDNDEESKAEFYGIQGSLQFPYLVPSGKLSTQINFSYVKGRELFKSFSFDQEEETILDLNDLRSQPDYMFQWQIKAQPSNKLSLILDQTLMTSSLTRNSILLQAPELLQTFNFLYSSGFYTLDLTGRYKINKNLFAHLKIKNLFNKQYSGIDAVSDGDGLIYNPQSRRIWRVALSYRLN